MTIGGQHGADVPSRIVAALAGDAELHCRRVAPRKPNAFGQNSPSSDQPNSADELALQQSRLAEQHARLEKLLLRMAEFDAGANPKRAELLKKSFALSKEKDIQLQLSSLARMINQEKFKRAPRWPAAGAHRLWRRCSNCC